MKQLRNAVIVLWIAGLMSGLNAQVFGAQLDSARTERAGPRTILVIPEYDQDSLRSTHRAYQTAGAIIQDQLAHEFQFEVYDGSARNIHLECKPLCDGQARAQIISSLLETDSCSEEQQTSAGPAAAIDIVVFYHILAKDVFAEIGVKRLIRVSSLAIDLQNGNTLAYDDGSQQQAKFINPAEDLTNWTLSMANRHARDSAAFIGERLQAYRGSRESLYRSESSQPLKALDDIYLIAVLAAILVLILLWVSLHNWKLRRALVSLQKAQKPGLS